MDRTELQRTPQKKKAREYCRYLDSISAKCEFNDEDIDSLLEELIKIGVETEEYSKLSNKTAQTLNRSIKEALVDYLSKFGNSYSVDADIEKKILDKAFTAFYLVVYYEREYEEMEQLGDTLRMYQDYFEDYALVSQIKGRYLRRIGKEREAITCDKEAKRKLNEKGIENVWVDITYASSISILMEKRDPSLTQDEILLCKESIALAKERHSDYGKLNYLYAKLCMFSLVNGDNDKSYDECRKIIDEAKEELRKAIEKEDKTKDYYTLSVTEYKSYLRQADLILAEIRLTHSIKSHSDDVVKQIDSKFERLQAKNMELIAIFSSIVAIIVVAIGLFSKEYPIKHVLIAIVVMNTSIIAVYSTLLLLLDNDNNKKYLLALSIAAFVIYMIVNMV